MYSKIKCMLLFKMVFLPNDQTGKISKDRCVDFHLYLGFILYTPIIILKNTKRYEHFSPFLNRKIYIITDSIIKQISHDNSTMAKRNRISLT